MPPTQQSAIPPAQPMATAPPIQPTAGNANYVNPNAAMQGVTGGAPGVPDVGDKYKQGLETAQQSGVEAPSTSGAAGAGVNGITGGPTPQPQPQQLTALDQFVQTNDVYKQAAANIDKTYNEYLDSQKTRESSVDEYKRLAGSLGLEEINTELMNMERIISGTDDDIRDEITKSGNFATESQVVALGASRNKQLIKRYNQLGKKLSNLKNNWQNYR